MNKILFVACLAVAALAHAAPSRYEFAPATPTHKATLGVTLDCDGSPEMTAEFGKSASLKAAGVDWSIVSTRPATPSETPIHLVFLVPADGTLRDSHRALLENLGQLPGTLASLGHTNHSVEAWSYSGCPGDGLKAVVQISSTDSANVLKFSDALEAVPQRNEPACKPVSPLAVLGSLVSGSGEKIRANAGSRPVYLVALFDGVKDPATPDPTAADARGTAGQLKGLFHSVTLLQPDVAPAVMANPRRTKRLMEDAIFSRVLNRRIAGMLRGSCLSDMSPEECDTDEEKAARDGKVQVYRDAMLKVASGSPFVRSSQFITREGLVGMYKENAETQLAAATARINALVPRETGLDCLGLELYDGQAGRLVLVGGLGDTELTCAGAPGSGSVKASASASVASAITANTPFRYSRTVVACANTAPAGALDGADLKLSANRGGQDVTCVSAKVSAPAAFDDGVAQLLCATQGSGSGGGVDPMVVAGLVGGLLVVFALVMVARRRAQPPSSL